MKSERRLTSLLEPGRTGRLETRDRIVMAPMGTNLGGGARIRYIESSRTDGAYLGREI